MTEVIVWQGWLGGIAIGIFLVVMYVLTGKLLGASTAYGNICSYVSRMPFFQQGEYEEKSSWRLWFIVGIPLGGLLGALTSPESIVLSMSMGELYNSVLPASLWGRGLWLIAGGILIGFGARAAGGCQSGHAITGISLMNPPSILAAAGFFVGGVIMVQLLFM